MIYTVKSDVLTVSVTDEGGSLTSIKYNGEERLWQGGEAWKSSDVVIFPILGHAGEFTVYGVKHNLKSHGIVRYSKLALKEISDDSVTLCLSDSEDTLKNYPFKFEFEICYKVSGNSVTVNYEVRAKEGCIPFYLGGHAGMFAPDGAAVIKFEKEQNPVQYPLNSDISKPFGKVKSFVLNKRFFKEEKTLQLGGIDGAITAKTSDGYEYTYKSNCPLWAFWSNENIGDYVCVEPWWGINDFALAPRELALKPFINFADEKGKRFAYTLTVNKV